MLKQYLKKCCLCVTPLILSLCRMPVAGQSPSNLSNATFSIKAGPNAQALGETGNFSVNLSTGTPEISIPLYHLREGSISVPISAHYRASGILVEQDPTWIGLGWVLNAGGAVSRVINGQPDELTKRGYIRMNTESPWQFDETIWEQVTPTPNFYNDPAAYSSLINLYGYDPAPDEFTFNIGGRVGKFIFDRNGGVITNEKVNIVYDLSVPSGSTSTTKRLNSFTITVEDGTKYFFSQREAPWVQNKQSNQTNASDSYSTLAWYLTKITSAGGVRTVDLTYSTESTGWRKISTSEVSGKLNTTISRTDSRACIEPEGGYLSYLMNTYATNSTGTIPRLSMIKSPEETIVFRSSSYKGFIRLDEIEVMTPGGNNIRKFLFTYKSYSGNRFFLQSIQETSIAVAPPLTTPPYEFQYIETPMEGISYRDLNDANAIVAGMDHWGYFNGSRNERTMIPNAAGELYITLYDYVAGANRQPNATLMKAGILERIKYPTGGYTTFSYEPHDYSYVNNTATKTSKIPASGMRVTQIVTTDPVKGIEHSKTYQYTSPDNSLLSSGVIANEPVYQFNFNSAQNTFSKAFNATIRTSYSLRPIDILYSQVIERSSDGSKTIYKYTTTKDYPDTPYYGDGTYIGYEVQDGIVFDNTPVLKKIHLAASHPFKSNYRRHQFMRGLLKEKTSINAAGAPLETITCNYTPRESARVYASHQVGYNFEACYGQGPLGLIFFHHYEISLGRAELTKQVSRMYDPSNSSLSTATERSYVYNQKNKQVQEETFTNSKGDQIITSYRYPLDYQIQADQFLNAKEEAAGILQLISKNCIYSVVEKKVTLKKSDQTLADAKVIDVEFIGYHSDKPFPKTYYKLETISPIGDYNEYYFALGTLYKDSRLKPKASFSYNSNENLTGYSKTNGVSNAFYWSYNGNHLFAEVENASSSQIFHTSFEEGEFDDSQAKTGRQSMLGDYVFTPPTGFTPAAGSVLSYWYYENGTWRYREQPYSGGSVTLALGEMIDEVRIHPANAQMSTYTYDPYRGLSLSSSSAPNGTTAYYEHDVLGRIRTLRGLNREIIKSYLYHYEE